MHRVALGWIAIIALIGCLGAGESISVVSGNSASVSDPAARVRATEQAFAKTMADRKLDAFANYVAEEGVFFGRKGVQRGRAAVVDAWKPFFEGEKAPFSWKPETVEVLASGSLALSSGPVLDPQGNRIGTFSTIWRKEADGNWRVVFDKGCPVCESEGKPHYPNER